MKCKLALLLGLTLSACFCTFGVSSAQAFTTGSPSAFWDTLDTPTNVEEFLKATGGVADAAETEAIADVWFGVAGLEALPPVALVSAGIIAIDATWNSGLGSMIGQWLADPGPAYTSGSYFNAEQLCPWVGGPTAEHTGDNGTDYSIGTCGFLHGGTTGIGLSATSTAAAAIYATGHAWMMDFSFGGGSGGCTVNGSANQDVLIGINPSFATGLSGAETSCLTDWFTAYSTMTSTMGTTGIVYPNSDTVSGSTSCASFAHTFYGAATYTGSCYEMVLIEDQMATKLGGMSVESCGGSTSTLPTCPSTSITVGTSSGKACGGVVKICQNALARVDASGSQTQDVESTVNCYVTGTCSTAPQVMTLPRPQITETYTQYISRLRSLGFWGHIYTVDDDMDYPAATPALALQAQQITEVQVGTSTPIPIYWPLPGHGLAGAPTSTPQGGQPYTWPGSPGLLPTDTVTIQKVPDGYTGAPGPVAGGSPGGCGCPPIDMGPLTAVDYGSKFPFGAFALLGAAAGSFTGGGIGSPISFTVGDGYDGGSKTITLGSSAWTGTYRPIVFAILDFLAVLLLIPFALRLFGHPGGDS